MAKLEILWPFIKSFEGGFVDDPDDPGGATNMGVTIATWRKQGYDKNGDGVIDVKDLKKITEEDAKRIMRLNYWNRWKADQIADQSVANILVDWVWGSGAKGITIPQGLLGVKQDGAVGPITLSALNSVDGRQMFDKLMQARKEYIDYICTVSPAKKKFKKGWLRRLGSIGYGSLELNTIPIERITF